MKSFAFNETILDIVKSKLGATHRLSKAERRKIIKRGLTPSADELSFLLRQREYKRGFTSRLLFEYDEPIQLLELLIETCTSIGQNTRKRISTEGTSQSAAIRRLFQKSTLLASEVLFLISGGYAAGALSRWRSLFETSLIALFLAIEDDDVAERYLAHHSIEDKKQLDSFIEHAPLFGLQNPGQEQIDRINEEFAAAIAKYGPEFSTDYGWAASTLGKKRPTLQDLIGHTGSQIVKPFYKFSSNYVHGGPLSLFHNLGYIDGILGDETIAAPSNIGFADPALLTAISYMNSTLAYLSIKPNEEDLILFLTLPSRTSRLHQAFVDVEAEIVRREQAT